MSFLRHGETYPSDGGKTLTGRAPAHRLDEFPTGYSLASCSPAEPAPASPVNLILLRLHSFVYEVSANGNLSLIFVSHRRGAAQRFLSRDPYRGDLADPASLHKYVYSDSDPVNLSDPSGMLVKTAPATEYTELVEDIGTAFAITVSTLAIAKSIECVWVNEASWDALGYLVDNLPAGVGVTGLAFNGCAVEAILGGSGAGPRPRPQPRPQPEPQPQPEPKPQPCIAGIGQCLPWRNGNQGPGDQIITYQTIHPAPSCGDFGLDSFAEQPWRAENIRDGIPYRAPEGRHCPRQHLSERDSPGILGGGCV